MAIHIGCEENRRTPMLDERTCPVCGAEVEVFVRDGRLVDDFACDCGYVFQREEALDTAPKPVEEREA